MSLSSSKCLYFSTYLFNVIIVHCVSVICDNEKNMDRLFIIYLLFTLMYEIYYIYKTYFIISSLYINFMNILYRQFYHCNILYLNMFFWLFDMSVFRFVVISFLFNFSKFLLLSLLVSGCDITLSMGPLKRCIHFLMSLFKEKNIFTSVTVKKNHRLTEL